MSTTRRVSLNANQFCLCKFGATSRLSGCGLPWNRTVWVAFHHLDWNPFTLVLAVDEFSVKVLSDVIDRREALLVAELGALEVLY